MEPLVQEPLVQQDLRPRGRGWIIGGMLGLGAVLALLLLVLVVFAIFRKAPAPDPDSRVSQQQRP